MAVDIPGLFTSMQMGPGGSGTGRGDVLLGALYDVRDIDGQPQFTFINIVNTDPIFGVIAKLRFREYKRSVEVLDIHIALSKNDVWSGIVYKDPASGRAYLVSPSNADSNPNPFNSRDIAFDTATTWPLRLDLDQVYPLLPASPTGPFGGKGVPFSTQFMTADKTRTNSPFLPLTETENIARTTYGYFEVIGEERVAGDFDKVNLLVNRLAMPVGCNGAPYSWTVYDPITVPTTPAPANGRDVTDFLTGDAWIVSVTSGSAFQYKLEAISNFSVNVCGIAQGVGDIGPTLTQDGQGMISAKLPGVGGAGTAQPGFGGSEQLEFLLSKKNIIAQYTDDPGLAAKTSIVVTFPTKWFHYNTSTTDLLAGDAGTPFTGPKMTIQDGITDRFDFQIYDRDEHLLTVTPQTPIISPVPPGQSFTPRWPFEVNILGLYNIVATTQTKPPHSVIDAVGIGRDNLLISTFLTDPVTGARTQDFKYGWIRLDLGPTLTADGGGQGDQSDTPNVTGENTDGAYNFFATADDENFETYLGLPAIGFVMTQYVNGAIAAPGGTFPPYFFNGIIPWAFSVDWTIDDD